jgi:hypothetical protein
MNNNYVPRKKVTKVLVGVHYQTVNNLVRKKEIEIIKIGTKFGYNLNKYIQDNNIVINQKKFICYCRVSSTKTKRRFTKTNKWNERKISKSYNNL